MMDQSPKGRGTTSVNYTCGNRTFAAIICVLTLISSPSQLRAEPAMVDAELDFCRLELTFADEFDDLSLEPREIGSARWITHTPWNGDFGDAAFLDPGHGSPFSVQDGILSITAAKNAAGRWTSGLLASADSQGAGFGLQYGYFEARTKLPTGPGTWPAFWLHGFAERGKTDPVLEVDILEYYGHARASYQAALHVWPRDPARSAGGLTSLAVPEGSLEEGFHTYGASVTPKYITFYLDRKPMWQLETPDSHRNRLMILINLALGSGYSTENTPNPVVMQVDYVRAYAFSQASTRCLGE